jgi:REP element-mobilizing transposase RayT
MATWAAEGLVEAATENGWRIVRGAVMATHIHVVLPLLDDKPWWIQKILKGHSSHYMSEKQGKCWRWWTRGGRKDVLFNDESMLNVMRYIEEQEHMLVMIVDNKIVPPPPARVQETVPRV